MLRNGTIFITISLFASTALLLPTCAAAQQILSAHEDRAFGSGAVPQPPDPFQRPGNGPHSPAEDNGHADSLSLLQWDGRWSTTFVQYSFVAPPSFYGSGRNQTLSPDWDSALTGVFVAYLNHRGTFTRVTTNLEMSGERRDANGSGNPGGQALTMEWELAHLVPSRLGSLEFAAGVYRQRLLSYAPFANTAIADTLAGYPVSAAGAESSVTLPDRNLTLMFRYGSQQLNHATRRQRMSILELSWSW